MESFVYRPRWLLVATLAGALLALGVWFAFDAMKDEPVDHKITSLALSPSRRWLAAGTMQGRISIFDQAGRAAPRQIQSPARPLNDLQFSPDESRLALAGRDLAICNLAQAADFRFLKDDQRNYGTVRYSADGSSVLVITGSSTIEVLDAQSGAPRLSICCSTIYGEVAYTPDGETIVNAGHLPRLWKAGSGQLVGQLVPDRRTFTFRSIAFDPTHEAVVMGSQDGRVYLWDLPARRLAAISEPQPEYVDAVAVIPTGWIAYAASGRILRLWNPATGQHRAVAGALPTSNLIPTPDGASILFGTAQGAIEAWSLDTGRRVSVQQIPNAPARDTLERP